MIILRASAHRALLFVHASAIDLALRCCNPRTKELTAEAEIRDAEVLAASFLVMQRNLLVLHPAVAGVPGRDFLIVVAILTLDLVHSRVSPLSIDIAASTCFSRAMLSRITD